MRTRSIVNFFFFLMIRRPPRSTLFPYTTALPILHPGHHPVLRRVRVAGGTAALVRGTARVRGLAALRDRKSTRLNSSHANISYAVFCLKKKTRPLQDRAHN